MAETGTGKDGKATPEQKAIKAGDDV